MTSFLKPLLYIFLAILPFQSMNAFAQTQTGASSTTASASHTSQGLGMAANTAGEPTASPTSSLTLTSAMVTSFLAGVLIYGGYRLALHNGWGMGGGAL